MTSAVSAETLITNVKLNEKDREVYFSLHDIMVGRQGERNIKFVF